MGWVRLMKQERTGRETDCSSLGGCSLAQWSLAQRSSVSSGHCIPPEEMLALGSQCFGVCFFFKDANPWKTMTAATGIRTGEVAVIHFFFFLKRTVTVFALKPLHKWCGCTKAGKQLKEVEYRNSLCSVVVAKCLSAACRCKGASHKPWTAASEHCLQSCWNQLFDMQRGKGLDSAIRDKAAQALNAQAEKAQACPKEWATCTYWSQASRCLSALLYSTNMVFAAV